MRYWWETLAVARRILTELWRRRRSLMFWAIFPVLVLILNSLILAERASISLRAAFELSAPVTLVGAALFFSCLGGSVATVVSEREQRTLKRLFLSPLSGTSYFFGIFLAHVSLGLGQTLVVGLVAAIAGVQWPGWPLRSLGIIVLSIASYVGVGFILGTQFARRAEDVNALVATFGVPLLIVSGSFLPVRFFPPVLKQIAVFNPIFHMNNALLGTMSSRPIWSVIAPHVYFLVVFALVMVGGGWLCYRRMVQVERRL